MAFPAIEKISVEEYLQREKQAEVRHEFVDGVMIAMAGEKRVHNKLARRFVLLLEAIADSKNCEVVIETVKVRTRDTRYRYPDFAVSCNPGEDPRFLENPCLIVEILSDSTEHTDFGKKLDEYTRLPSLQRYVLVASDSKLIVVYRREKDRWTVESLEFEGEFDVPCLDTTVTLEQIYAGLEF
jgi:Uma2 family endonuclease